jgi:hypothetical protein
VSGAALDVAFGLVSILFVLSLPAVLVLTQRAFVSRSRVEQVVLTTSIVWCLLLLGMTGFDEWLASSPTGHFQRCFVANALLVLLLWMLSGCLLFPAVCVLPAVIEKRARGDRSKSKVSPRLGHE